MSLEEPIGNSEAVVKFDMCEVIGKRPMEMKKSKKKTCVLETRIDVVT